MKNVLFCLSLTNISNNDFFKHYPPWVTQMHYRFIFSTSEVFKCYWSIKVKTANHRSQDLKFLKETKEIIFKHIFGP